MSATEDRRPPTTGGRPADLALPGQHGDLVPADPVYDAELVSETRSWRVMLTAWWLRSPRVPLAFKSRPHAVQAVRDAASAALRTPWRLLGAVVRGAAVAFRVWRRWVTVRDFREAAEQSEKLADKFSEIRGLTLFRWKVTGAVAAVLAVAGLVGHTLDGNRPLWTASVLAAVALAVLGRRKDGNPGRRAVLAGPREPRGAGVRARC